MDPDMVIDHNNVIHVVWSYEIDYWHRKIMYIYSEDDGEIWSEPLDLTQNTELWMSKPHIACDSKNNLFVTYDYATGTSDKMIYLMVYKDHLWGEPIIISEGMPGSHYNYVIIDHNDRMYVFWDYSPTGDNYYRYLENNIWSDPYCPYPGNDEIYALVEAEISTNNSIHWMGASAGTTYYGERLQYFYYDYSFNIWYPPQKPVNDTIQVGLDITLNNNEIPESTYRKRSTISMGVNSDSTMYIKKEENSWGSPDMVAGKEKHHEYQQIAIDQNSDVHILDIQMPNEGLKLSHYQKKEKEWIEQIIDTCYIILFTDLEFNNNKLYVVYNKTWPVAPQVFESDLYYCKYDIVINIKEATNLSTELIIYPNPGRDRIYIEFENNKQQHIDLSIFDMTGKHIITIISETKPPGKYRQLWKVTDKNRKENAPSLYLVRLQSGRKTVTKTVEVLK